MQVAVSFIKSKYSEIETIKRINETNADYLHVDIMDGIFVANKNYTVRDIYKFTRGINKPLDVHLMVNNPEKYLRDLACLNVSCVTFHYEAVKDIDKMIDLIHSYGLKCGISLNPETKVNVLEPYLDKIEVVLLMSVHPGMGGQTFIMETVSKIDELRKLSNIMISIDGGINETTIKYVQKADMVISGSFVCLSDNYQAQINLLRSN